MIDDYLEYEQKTKSLKFIDLDGFSIKELREYLSQLHKEIERVNCETEKKSKIQGDAEKFFK